MIHYILAMLFLFGLFYLLCGLIVAVATFMAIKDVAIKKFTRGTNFVANLIVVLIVYLSWPIWVGAWLSKHVDD